jgi:hypothetical protein
MGQGYASNPLLDMRIHDINVVADPNRHAPAGPDPVGADGTSTPIPNVYPAVDSRIQDAAATTSIWWTGWWPVLHIRSANTLVSGASYVIQIAVDILGGMSIESVEMNHPTANQLNSLGLDVAAQDAYDGLSVAGSFSELWILNGLIKTLLFTLDTLSAASTLLPPPIYYVLLGILAAFSVLLMVYLYTIYIAVEEGIMDLGCGRGCDEKLLPKSNLPR